jgi:putative transposase
MPRGLVRIYGLGHFHFLTFSCYHRLPLLTPACRELFLVLLEKTRQEFDFAVAGYVVMPEHVHLLLGEPSRGDPSRVLQSLKLKMARRVLHRQTQPVLGKTPPAHFWQRRFYDFNVCSEETLEEKLEYIHQNPVRRGLVEHPEDWLWSSARYYGCGETAVVRLNEPRAA